MGNGYQHELMEDPKELAGFGFCSEENYRDLLECQKGTVTEESFNTKYLKKIPNLPKKKTLPYHYHW